MDCDTARDLLPFRRPAELPAGDLAALDQHLAGCAACALVARRQAEFDGAVSAAMRAVPVPPGLRDRLLAAAFARRAAAARWKGAKVVGLAAALLLTFGVGGGLIFVPTLVLLLGLGQVDAEATSLLAILPVVIAGTWRQHLYGNVRWRTAAIIGLAAVGGIELGVLTANALPEATLRRLFAVLVLLVAAQLAWRADSARRARA